MLIHKGALIVSCQARADNPLHGPIFMSAMARAVNAGGAAGFRANGAEDVAAIRAISTHPIIGIDKIWDDRFPVYITPHFASAARIAQAGADIVGVDATRRPRDGDDVDRLIGRIRHELHREVFADVSSVAEGLFAHAAGATYVATTLAGYTAETAAQMSSGPDLDLLSALVAAIDGPVVAEGRFDTPDLVAEAFRRGAHAVVVGTAITNPLEITRKFALAAAPWAEDPRPDAS
ncbi:N-acetylmannosamine-6-phosphate 2-epimerase [Microvirga antarctica]|uniref:N-acetylmannosamine-6-phosphate 2-epimerase n=1 Tax=Microvirga antarctica TaxID=2819233 RepID=UPI001B3176EC|nr:N-acetylmannosamine-6-phosphate 2-epimerase [Microvirga antarctica]